jgi:hypothetical protein
MDLKEIGCECKLNSAGSEYDPVQWKALVNTTGSYKLSVSTICREFLHSFATITFTRKALLDGIIKC